MTMLSKKELLAPVFIGLTVYLTLKIARFLPKKRLVTIFWLCLATSTMQAAATEPNPAASGVTRWTCNAFYLPARSIWQRTVAIEFDASDVRSVQIDGIPVYAFQVLGTTVLTAVDGERIQFDPADQSWSSDLRGIVSSQGRCVAAE
jgi:hypothetical protein